MDTKLAVIFPYTTPPGPFHYDICRFDDLADCGWVVGFKRVLDQEYIELAIIFIKGALGNVFVWTDRDHESDWILTRNGEQWGRISRVELGGLRRFAPLRYGRTWNIRFNGTDYGQVRRGIAVGKRGLMWHYHDEVCAINLGHIGKRGKGKRALWPEAYPAIIPWDVAVTVALVFRCMIFQQDSGGE